MAFADIIQRHDNLKIQIQLPLSFPITRLLVSSNRAHSTQPTDSQSVAQSAKWPLHVLIAHLTGQLYQKCSKTHNWIYSSMEFTPGFYGGTVNKLMITSDCLWIWVTKLLIQRPHCLCHVFSLEWVLCPQYIWIHSTIVVVHSLLITDFKEWNLNKRQTSNLTRCTLLELSWGHFSVFIMMIYVLGFRSK